MHRAIGHLRSAALYAFLAGCLGVIVLSLLPAEEVPDVDLWDKSQHFFAYAVLGGLGVGGTWRPGRSVLALLLSLVLLGAGLEVGQAFSPGRSPETADAIANALGAIVGTLGFRAVISVVARARRRDETNAEVPIRPSR